LSAINKTLTDLQTRARFGAVTRNDGNLMAGKLYRTLRLIRDDISAKVMDEVPGGAEDAKALRASRDTFAKFADHAEGFADDVRANPDMAPQTLAKAGDHEQAKVLKEMLSSDQFKKIGEAIVEQVQKTLNDSGAKAAKKKLDSFTDPVAKEYLGDEAHSELRTQLNAAQAIEARWARDGSAKGPDPSKILGNMKAAIHVLMGHPISKVTNSLNLGSQIVDGMKISPEAKAYIKNYRSNTKTGAAGAGVNAADADLNQEIPGTLGSLGRQK